MNTSTTRWLLLLTLALGIFIVLYERGIEDTDRRADRATALFPDLDPKRVTALSLQHGTNAPIRLERAGDQWEFRSPFVYPAQPAAVERLLRELAGLEHQSRLSAADLRAQTNGLAGFGLEPPAVVVGFTQENGGGELRLGGATVLGKGLFAQVAGETDVRTVGRALLEALPATVNAWRDTALVNLAGLRFDRVEVRPITNGFEVVRNPTNGLWQMTKPLPIGANHTKVELLLQQLELARVNAFVVDDPRVDLEPFGLQPPERELVLGQGTNDVVVLQFGHSPSNTTDQVYVRRLASSNIVLVARNALEPWRAGFREFCDRRLMVFRPEDVDRIEVQADEPFTLVRATNQAWQVVQPYPDAADPVLVLEFLAQLYQLEFDGFELEVATDFAAYGLAPPRRQYRLLSTAPGGPNPTNRVLAQLDLGNPIGHKRYARRSLENSVVTMLDPARLPRAAFELRDRRLWTHSTNEIGAITARQAGRTRRLLRTGPMQWAVAPGSEGPVNPVTLEETAYRLGQLRAERWVAAGSDALARYRFTDADLRVTLELLPADPPRSRELRFGRGTPAGGVYAAVQLEGFDRPVVFECPASTYEFVLTDLALLPPAREGDP